MIDLLLLSCNLRLLSLDLVFLLRDHYGLCFGAMILLLHFVKQHGRKVVTVELSASVVMSPQ
jgi:hypothetical protein